MPQKETPTSRRIYQIDLFRFLAAFFVVLYHYLFRGFMADDMSKLHFFEIGDYFKYGYLGVDLFFMISGFVITLSVKSGSVSDFFISRIARLYPSYWLSVLVTSGVIVLFGAPRFELSVPQVLLNLTMFQNYLRISLVDGVYWSLFVEIKFYIFIVGNYLVLNKIKEFKLDYVIYAWLALSVGYVTHIKFGVFEVLNVVFILDWSSYFIAGMIFYQIFKTRLNARYLILLLITMGISLYHAVLRVNELESHYKTTFSPWYISGIIMGFYLLMFLVSVGKLQRINSPKLVKIGLLTYPLYLLHQNIGFVIFNRFGTESSKYALVFSTIVLMLVAAYSICAYYEQRVSDYLRVKLKQLVALYGRTTIGSR